MSYINQSEVTIAASSSKLIADFLNRYCLDITEHPADFLLLEELNELIETNIIIIFDKVKTWAVERTMLSIEHSKHAFTITYLDTTFLQIKKGTQEISVRLSSSENKKHDVIQIEVK